MNFQLTVGSTDQTSYLVRFERNARLCQPGQEMKVVCNHTLPEPNTWDDLRLWEEGVLVFTGYVMAYRKIRDGSEDRIELDCADTWVRATRAWNFEFNRQSTGQDVKYWISTLAAEAGVSVLFNQAANYSVIDGYPIPIAPYSDIISDLLKFGAWYVRINPDGVAEVGKFGDVPTGAATVGIPPAVVLDKATKLEHRYEDSSYRNIVKVRGIDFTSIKSGANLYPGPDRITYLDTNFSSSAETDRLATEIFNTFYQPKLVSTIEHIADPVLRIGYEGNVNLVGINESSQITTLTTRANGEGYTQSVTIGDLCPRFFGIGPYGWTTGSNPNCIPGLTCPQPPGPKPICSPAELWPQHVILAYHDHIWETFDFGGPCYPYPTWVDIKGNIEGTITGFQVMADGTVLAVTSSGSSPITRVNPYDVGGYLWKRQSGNVWAQSDSAQKVAADFGLWSRYQYDEDGTGPHSFAGTGCIFAPCSYAPMVHWSYQGGAGFIDMIGNAFSLGNSVGQGLPLGSALSNGTWLGSIQTSPNISATMPLVTEICITNPALDYTCISGGVVQPTVFNKGQSILLAGVSPGHFTAYPNELYHHFDRILHIIGTTEFFDGLSSAVYGPHYTDHSDRVWEWGTSVRRRESNVWSVVAGGTAIYTHSNSGWTQGVASTAYVTPVDLGATAVYCLLAVGGTLFAGTDNGLLFSNDNGTSWAWAYRDLGGSDYKALVYANGLIYIGLFNGVAMLLGSGISTTNLHASVEALVADSFGNLYAGTHGLGVQKSFDQGLSFVDVTNGINGFVYALAIDPTNDLVLYVGTDGGIYKTTNGAASWVNVFRGTPTIISDTTSVVSIVIDPTNTNIIYAGTTSAGVYRSTDTGNSWTAFNTGLSPIGLNARYRVSISPSGALYLAIEDTGGTFFRGIYFCSGSQWTSIVSNLAGTNFTAILATSGILLAAATPVEIFGGYYSVNVPPSGTTRYACGFERGNSGVILKSTDDGTSWGRIPSTDAIGDVAENIWTLDSAPTRLYVTTNSNGYLAISGNEGQSWDVRFNPHAPNFLGGYHSIGLWVDGGAVSSGSTPITPPPPTIVQTYIYRSLDTGTTWAEYPTEPLQVNTLLSAAGTIYAGCNGGIYLNNGFGWEPFPVALLSDSYRAIAYDATSAYLYFGNDSGAFFNVAPTSSNIYPPYNFGSAVHDIFSVNTTVYVATGGGVFYNTNTGVGTSWTALSTGLPSANAKTIIYTSGNLFAGGGTAWNGIYRSSGGSWSAVIATEAVVDLLVISGSILLAGTISSGVLKSTDGGNSWSFTGGLHTGQSESYTLAYDGTSVFAGGAVGVYVSGDLGSTWSLLSSSPLGVTAITTTTRSGEILVGL